MSHLPAIALKRWIARERLSADDLNGNFRAVLDLIETVMAAALMPDPAVNALEVRIAKCEERLARIEQMLSLHSRQRNEMEWAPMAYVADVMQLVQSLIGPMTERAEQLLEAHKEAQVLHDAISRRLARLEQRPDAALAEDHRVLVEAHQKLAAQADMTLGQVTAVRSEVGHLIRMAAGHARERNEMQWTPLATAGHLLQRIMQIEQRMNGSE